MKTPDVRCSFCGNDYSGEESKGRIVAGAAVFICRNCVDICIQVFADYDPVWIEAKIQQLNEALKPPTSS
jgi:hypothetical protein